MWSIFKIALITLSGVSAWAGTSSSDIYTDINRFNQELRDPRVFNPNTCEQYLVSQAEYLHTRPYDFYTPKTPDEKRQFFNQAKAVTTEIFNIRLFLKEKVSEFYSAGTLSENCVKAIRRAMRVARTAEEMLLVYQLRNHMIKIPEYKDTNGKAVNGTLMGDYPQTFKNPEYYNANEEVELKSGDLLIMRGVAVVSALIARIGDEDGMFSHVGVFYIEPQTQKKYIIESLISTGLIITPYDDWMHTVESRVAVYRHHNPAVGAEAAQKLYEYYLQYMKMHGHTVPYDFAIDTSNYDKMFCSEVASLAYDLVSDGKIKLPTFTTSLENIKDTNFLKMMGIRGLDIFSPNDLEIEPQFELVAEFRRIEKSLTLRHHDLTMQVMFDWMHSKNYDLSISFLTSLKTSVVKLLVSLGISDKVSKDIPKPSLNILATLRKLQQETLVPRIENFEKQFIEKTGQIPAHVDMLAELERIRIEDCLRAKNKTGKPLFHHYFRPEVLSCE